MKWWRARRLRTKVILIVVGFFLLLRVASSGSSEQPTTGGAASIVPTLVSTSGAVVVPATVAPATAAPTPPPTPAPTPAPVVLRGTGQTATDSITLPFPTSIATFTHIGSRNFIVKVFRGTQESILINEIGTYNGKRPLIGTDPIKLSIEADGGWTVSIQAISCCAASGEFAGKGDSVSNLFNPPGGATTWDFSHDGRRNYIVYAHCRGGDQLLQNRIGAFSGSTIVSFGGDPWCFWEVRADGNWSLTPR